MQKLLALSLGLFAALPAPAFAAKTLKIVTTTSDLASIAKDIGGDRADVSSIAQGTQDPHFIEAKPSYMITLRDADLFIQIGLELEAGWEGLLLTGSRNDKIRAGAPGNLDVSAGVEKLEVPTGTVDRSMGDVHAFGNPHYWLDPWNARIAAREIAERMISLAPENRAAYEAGLAKFTEKLDRAMFGDAAVAAAGGDKLWAAAKAGALDKLPGVTLGGWYAKMAPYHGSAVITYHKSWSYLLSRFQLRSIGEMELKPGIPPSPAHLLELIQAARRENARFIITEPYRNVSSAEFVASKIGIPVLSVPQSVGGAPQATSYITLMEYLVNSMSAALAAKK
jgi:ABC-type Zn uptake system ZnuABC Zn-binding protein ZnuA